MISSDPQHVVDQFKEWLPGRFIHFNNSKSESEPSVYMIITRGEKRRDHIGITTVRISGYNQAGRVARYTFYLDSLEYYDIIF